MRNKISLILGMLVIAGIVLVFGCTQSTSSNTNDAIITMHFSPGLIDAPPYTITIYGNGTVVYDEN